MLRYDALAEDDKSAQRLEEHQPGFWATVVAAHGWSARGTVEDQQDTDTLQTFMSSAQLIAGNTGALLTACPLSASVLRALLHGDVLCVYAQMLAGLPGCPGAGGKGSSGGSSSSSSDRGSGSSSSGESRNSRDLWAHLVHTAQVLRVSLRLLRLLAYRSQDHASLYRELRAALVRSGLLEHAAAALVRTAAAAAVETTEAPADGAASFSRETTEAAAHVCSAIDEANRSLESALSLTIRGLGMGWQDLCPNPHPAYVAWFSPPAGEDGVEPSSLREVRSLLSGPCVQFWLAWQLTLTRLRHDGGAGGDAAAGSSGAAAAATAAAAAAPRRNLLAALLAPGREAGVEVEVAAFIFQLTALGPAMLPLAQPPSGWRLPLLPPPALEAAAGALLAAAAASCGVPYRAVHVYDLIHAARNAVRGKGAQARGDVRGCWYATLLQIRLLMELRPRQAAARLSGLWRAVAAALPSAYCLEGPREHGELVRDTGCLLRLLIEDTGGEDAGGAGTGAAGAAGTAENAHVLTESGAAAAAGPDPSSSSGCCYSLRCALDVGLLPSLERLLRNVATIAAASSLPSSLSAPGAGPEGFEPVSVLLTSINSILRYSGVWPAVLAHGSVREVASLVVTLWKLVLAFQAQNVRVMYMKYAGQATVVKCLEDVGPTGAMPAPAWVFVCGFLGALLEQLEAVMLPALPPPRTEALPPQAPQAVLALNDALEEGSPPMQLEWLVRAGGRPQPGSPAAEQQLLLASFALGKWLPVLVGGVLQLRAWHAPLDVLVSRLLLRVALQCFAARLRADILLRKAAEEDKAEEAAAGHEPGGPSGIGCGTGGRAANVGEGGSGGCSPVTAAAAATRYVNWRSHLFHDLGVLRWLQATLVRSRDPTESAEPTGGGEPKLAEAAEASLRQRLSLLPTVLDTLEVVAACEPSIVLPVLVAAEDQPTSPPPPPPQQQDSRCSLNRSPLDPRLAELLQRHGRTKLLAVLTEFETLTVVPPEAASAGERAQQQQGSGGDAGGSGSGAHSGGAVRVQHEEGAAAPAVPALPAMKGTSEALEAAFDDLGQDLTVRYNFLNLPDLPAPCEAYDAVCRAAGGIRLCANSRCWSLEGPSGCVAPGDGKTCGRCKAVVYCCGACAWQDWEGGHKDECGKLAAAAQREAAEAQRR